MPCVFMLYLMWCKCAATSRFLTGFGVFLLILASNQMIVGPQVSKISQLVPEEVVVLGKNHLRGEGRVVGKSQLGYLI